MAHELYTAIWKIKFSATSSLNMIAKLSKIKVAIMNAYTYLQEASRRMKATNAVYLFAAPEYYWIKDSNYNLYNEQEKQTIYDEMANTSKVLNDFIIVPGTVNWQVRLDEYVGAIAISHNTTDKSFVGFSTAPVFLDGKIILHYYKKFNDKEIDKRLVAVYYPGPGAGKQSFSAKGLTFGLEVCGDINLGQLQMSLQGGRPVDVEVLISGTVTHNFTDQDISKIPVRDGGAFVHCDNTGIAEKNGVWVLDRGKGWHGTRGFDDQVLTFTDLDGTKRTIALNRKNQNYAVGQTIDVSALEGFGSTQKPTAVINDPGRRYVKKFTITLPSSHWQAQSAVVEPLNNGNFKISLMRWMWTTREIIVTPKPLHLRQFPGIDPFGLKPSGAGNVSKIGKLVPNPSDDVDLVCYAVAI
jgi:hypothetical protein